MTIYQVREILGWCSVINVGLMIAMFLILWLGRGLVYKMHSKLFPISESQFNVIAYSFLSLYKLVIYVFNIIPWVALCIVAP